MGFEHITQAQLVTIMNASKFHNCCQKWTKNIIIPSSVVCLQKQKRKGKLHIGRHWWDSPIDKKKT